MCIACIEFFRGKLTIKEYKTALYEVTVEDPEHYMKMREVVDELDEDEDDFYPNNQD